MPALGLLPGGVFADYGNYLPPQLPLVNMYAEPSAVEPKQFVLVTRPLLGYSGTSLGDGPIRAIYQADGVIGGAVAALSDNDFYAGGSDVGDVPGVNVATITGNEVGVIVTAGDDVKFWDGTTFRSVAFPDSAKVTKVAEQQGRFIFLRKDTHRYYWTEPLANMLDGSGDIVVDPLDFASAENEPDKLVDIIIFQDHLILGGKSTIELHGVTGNDNLPWAPTLGSTIATGVKDTGCMANWGNTFAWISNEYVVYAGTGRERISDDGIETLISQSGSWGLDSFTLYGTEFLRVKLDDYDLIFRSGNWAKWYSDPSVFSNGFIAGPVISRPALGVPVFGSKLNGDTLSFTDIDGSEKAAPGVERLFRFGLPIDGGAVPFNNVFLRCSKAIAADATIELRTTRDGGYSWSNWRSTSLGAPGEYRTKVEWRALGLFDQPGFLGECRVYTGTDFQISNAYFNETVGGRSR